MYVEKTHYKRFRKAEWKNFEGRYSVDIKLWTKFDTIKAIIIVYVQYFQPFRNKVVMGYLQSECEENTIGIGTERRIIQQIY